MDPMKFICVLFPEQSWQKPKPTAEKVHHILCHPSALEQDERDGGFDFDPLPYG